MSFKKLQMELICGFTTEAAACTASNNEVCTVHSGASFIKVTVRDNIASLLMAEQVLDNMPNQLHNWLMSSGEFHGLQVRVKGQCVVASGLGCKCAVEWE